MCVEGVETGQTSAVSEGQEARTWPIHRLAVWVEMWSEREPSTHSEKPRIQVVRAWVTS